MGQILALGTQFMGRETTIKEGEGKQKRGARTPTTEEAPEKASRTVPMTDPL